MQACAWGRLLPGLRSYGVVLWEIITGERPDKLRGLRAPECARLSFLALPCRMCTYRHPAKSCRSHTAQFPELHSEQHAHRAVARICQ